MQLTQQGIADPAFAAKGYRLPQYDRAAMAARTKAAPRWLHFGASNLLRAFPAVLAQRLLEQGLTDTGLIVCEGYDPEILDVFRKHDNLHVAVTLKGDGSVEKEVVGSIAESLDARAQYERLEQVFCAPTLQLATLTITEKGYALRGGDGEYFPAAAHDRADYTQPPATLMGLAAKLCVARCLAGQPPLALVSLDNVSHNGSKLHDAVLDLISHWAQTGQIPSRCVDALSSYSFTWSMIDKITPRPSAAVAQRLAADGLAGMAVTETAKHTFLAPFVNAEQVQYLVIEDAFPSGRPPLEATGVLFAPRETVDQVEKMKVCTCLNPLHTVLGIFGCLLNIPSIAKTMDDPQLKRLVELVGYAEGLPVVKDPGILDPRDFIEEVLTVRFPNPYVPDTPQRIACDTSQILSIRFGETLKARRAAGFTEPLTGIPLFFAGYLRYLMAVDDGGQPMPLSPDPRAEELAGLLSSIRLGGKGPFDAVLRPLLQDEALFGVNLYAYGLASQVAAFFARLVEGPGAVRRVLVETLG